MTISVWILGDQLLQNHPALRHAESLSDRSEIRVVMIESSLRTRALPYQRKKLVLLFSAMRHYVERLRAEGWQVDYRHSDSFLDGIRDHLDAYPASRLVTMAASEYATRHMQSRLSEDIGIPSDLVKNGQFLIEDHNPYPAPKKAVIMENFYREMRRHYRVLIDDAGSPIGGAWNFDKDNRQSLPKTLTPPAIAGFTPDAITESVMAMVDGADHGVGSAAGFNLAVTHEDAERAADDFFAHRLRDFGRYEDAMTTRSATVFHSLLSPYLNIGLLDPLSLIRRAEAAYHAGEAPINSVEGFIRQIIGWREYIYWQYWRQMPDLWRANSWAAPRPMPQFFWDGSTDMNCLKHVSIA